MEIGVFKKWFAVNLIALFCISAVADLVRPVSVLPSTEILMGGDSCAPIISPDGHHVLFASTANNLLLTTNGSPIAATFPARFNIYLRNRTNETTILVSENLSGAGGGNGDSFPTGLSTNGLFALFESAASDLVPNDTNNVADIFVRDLVNSSNILVSVNTTGGIANGGSRGSVLTPDGRYVAFTSAATNLAVNDTNGIADVFVRDLQTGITVLASPGAQNASASNPSASENPEINDDGRYVSFYSTAINLVPFVSTNGIYLRDLIAEVTTLASTNARVVLSNSSVASYSHAISGDGKFVAYAASRSVNLFSAAIFRYSVDTGATDLVHTNALMPYGPRENIRALDITPDGCFIAFTANFPSNFVANATPAIVVWDGQTGITTLASRDVTNGVGIGSFDWPSLDSTGRFVCFTSTATNLTTNLVSGLHVYVRDLLLNQTTLVDTDSVGNNWNSSSTIPFLSANGRFVAFQSLGAPPAARNFNLFIRDLQTNSVELISVPNPALHSLSPNGSSALTPLSVNQNGRYVAFASLASNLTTNDTNNNRDVFVRDLLTETNILVSMGTNGFSAAGMSFEPAISGDGRFVAFTSTATNLIPGDTNQKQDVFVFDLQTENVVLGSVSTGGTVANNSSYSPVVDEDGSHLFFRSKASNLASGTFVGENLFWRDLQNSNTTALTTGGIADAKVTPDGRFAAFVGKISGGSASNLYIWDSSAAARIYTNLTAGIAVMAICPDGKRVAYILSGQLQVLDRTANTNWTIGAVPLVSHVGVKFSADGQFLTFSSSSAQGFTDTNGTFDVYLHHISSQTKTLVSRSHDISQAANGISDFPDVSYDGRFVAYRSAASNLVPNDTNGWPDVFVYDRLTGANRLLSANQSDKSGNNRSHAPIFSGDGRSLVFSSWASDLTTTDFNQSSDLFAFAFLYVTITRDNGQAPVISWPAMPGQTYQVQFKNNVDDADWQPVNGTIMITGNQGSIHDLSPGTDQRIYRIVAF